jgi:hypothetical protein
MVSVVSLGSELSVALSQLESIGTAINARNLILLMFIASEAVVVQIPRGEKREGDDERDDYRCQGAGSRLASHTARSVGWVGQLLGRSSTGNEFEGRGSKSHRTRGF